VDDIQLHINSLAATATGDDRYSSVLDRVLNSRSFLSTLLSSNTDADADEDADED
jgi:hypothetical protein